MKVVTKILLGFVAVILCGITACQVHYYKARRTPAVSGKVVDIETGEPIKGADVIITVYGFPSDPIAAIASPPRWYLTGADLKADAEGRFSFSSQIPPLSDSGVTWWQYLLWGPDKQIGIGVYIYTKDHMTVASESGGFEWELDDFYETYFRGENNEKLVTVERKRSGEQSYEYSIKTKTAMTEKDWEIKCKDTILHTRLGEEPYETWLFNDLVGYLERFPNGAKAGELFEKLRGTQPYSVERLREKLSSNELTEKQVQIYFIRDKKILELADKVTMPKEPLTLNLIKKDIEARRKESKEFENLAISMGFSIKGGGK